MIRVCFAAALIGVTGPLWAQNSPVELARNAQSMLDQAAISLQEASRTADRVSALTKTVRAYEAGLESLRSGLRQSILRAREIETEFAASQSKLTRLMVILQNMGRNPVPTVLLHPSGPTNTVRAAMMVEDVARQIDSETEALKQQLTDLEEIRQLQQEANTALSEALSEAQRARTELADAISSRVALPRSFNADPVRMRNLIRASETLGDFISQLARINIGAVAPAPGFEQSKGRLPSPVTGQVLHAANTPDAAGIARPGVILSAPQEAVVITPVDATIRYAGPLLDYGNTVILEPAPGFLLILAGLARLHADAGQVLSAGTPVGNMGGTVPDADSFLNAATHDGSGNRQETLYIELRNGDTALDPENWFAWKKE